MMMFRHAMTLAIAVVSLMALPSAHANNGHFLVDHGVIADPGRCQLESWVDRNDTDGINTFVTKPACTVIDGWQVAVPLEYQMSDSRFQAASLEAKTILARGNTFGSIAMTLGTRYDRGTNRLESAYVNLPWSAEVAGNLSFHLNAGLRHERANSNLYTTLGMAATHHFNQELDLVAEFAMLGSDSPTAAVGARWYMRPGWELDASLRRDAETDRDFAALGINIRF